MVHQFRSIAAAFILLAVTMPAVATEVVYPPGSRVGLVPPPGMVPSSNFMGFEDRGRKVAVLLITLPKEAYAELEKSATSDSLKQQGVTADAREAFPLPGGKALLLVGHQEVENTKIRRWLMVAALPTLTALVNVQVPEDAQSAYPDSAIRTALASLSARASVPVEEQLGLLPFKVADLAGFRVGALFPGRAIMLTDAADDKPRTTVHPHILVGVLPGGPQVGTDRDTFARNVFGTIPNLKDIRLVTSETLRLGGQQGHQILANGTDGATGTAITIIQWLRFGGGGFLHMVGVAPQDGWTPAYARFRTVRDGIEPR
jgi:hypothetical protein